MVEEKIKAAEMVGKVIISEETGKKFGNVGNVDFVVESGELLNITVENPSKYIDELNLKADEKGRTVIPFAAVRSIGDFVVISESELV
ncbi:MAG: PRC-barrel domain-containing protein [Candidatus Aenigmarchaeota archaeon]|nr:PRC-barrel domain-containing protein [Candidatus Aenigmarchaeota archaeon]